MQISQEDRDLLIRMDQKLTNFIDGHKQHIKEFEDHVTEDKKQFTSLHRFMWLIIGGGTLLGFILRTFK